MLESGCSVKPDFSERDPGSLEDCYRVLELALYHLLGKLPEPESTHDFF